MKVRILFVAVIAIVGLAVLFPHFPGAAVTVRPMEKITLATSNVMLSSLIFVADKEGLFTREGLAVDITITPTGKDALAMTLAGRADVAAAASPPLTRAIIDGGRPHIIATVAKSDRAFVLIANSDHGIREATDLRSKKVAVQHGTSFEYFLDSTLIDAGIPPSAVNRVDLAPAHALAALKRGTVDAATQPAPFTDRMLQSLGIPAVVLSPLVYTTHWNIVLADPFMAARPTAVEKLLRALLEAETFARQHPERAMNDAAQWIHLPRDDLAAYWDKYVFRVQLPQSLIVGMEDETRWILESRTSKSPAMPTPNFLDYLSVEPLRKVKPEAIRITQ